MNLGQPDLRLDRDAAPFVKSELVQVVFASGPGTIVSRDRFDARYEAVPPGSDGIAGAFRSKALAVLAKQIHEDFKVRRSATGDLLHGRSGDWLLQYAPGDWGVVEELKFRQVYRPLMDQ